MSAPLEPEFSADRQLRELILLAEGSGAQSLELPSVNRRSFLKLVGVAGGGLVLAFSVGSCSPLDGGGGGAQAADELLPTRSCASAPTDRS